MGKESNTNIISKIFIISYIQTNRRGEKAIKRQVWLDDEQIYSIRMPIEMLDTENEPVREFEMRLLGIKKSQSGKDIRPDRCYLGSLLRKVWRKLFS